MNKIKILLLTFAVTVTALLFAAPMSPVSAAIKDDIQAGACGAAGQPVCNSATATRNLNDTIAAIFNILSLVVGIVAVIMLIFAGFKYITSAGNEQAVAGAKKTLLYAIIGLVIVALAQVIVRFVLKNVT